ncbi:MAG: hypothetical protein ACK5R2_16650 [Cyanobacteriota bacterium]
MGGLIWLHYSTAKHGYADNSNDIMDEGTVVGLFIALTLMQGYAEFKWQYDQSTAVSPTLKISGGQKPK